MKWATTNHTKASLPPKKVMCIWWLWKVVLYYELLPENQMINSNKYCSQLDQLKATLDEKHPELVNRKCVIFHQDRAKLIFFFYDQAISVTAWLGNFKSSTIFTRHCTSDVHLFQSSQNCLNGQGFNFPEDWKRYLEQFFAQKGEKFWEDRIMKLPEKLLKAVEQSIEYSVQ